MKTKPPVKLPKAAVMFADQRSLDFKYGMTVFSKRHKKHPHFSSPVVIIACRTRQEARGIVRLHSMTPEKLLFVARSAISPHDRPYANGQAVLQALRLIP